MSVAVLRGWLTWAAGWTLGAEAVMWLATALDAWEERTEPSYEPMSVASWLPGLSYANAVALVGGLLLLLLARGRQREALRRAGLLLGALGLVGAAAGFAGWPEHDPREWYVALSALGAACAAAAAVHPGGGPAARATGRALVLPGAALVASAGFLGWTGLRGGSYWQWSGEDAVGYGLALAAAVVLVALGLSLGQWSELRGRRLRWSLVVVGVLGAVYGLAGVAVLLGTEGVLYRFEEYESPWSAGLHLLLVGTGLAALGVAALRRRGDLAAWSLASATGFGLLALWQESTWGRVIG